MRSRNLCERVIITSNRATNHSEVQLACILAVELINGQCQVRNYIATLTNVSVCEDSQIQVNKINNYEDHTYNICVRLSIVSACEESQQVSHYSWARTNPVHEVP